MKTIDRTEPSVTSLELSKRITEALKWIDIELKTNFYWVHNQLVSDVADVKFHCEVEHQGEHIYPALDSDDLMALLPQLCNGNFVRVTKMIDDFYETTYQKDDGFYNGQFVDTLPEALGKLLVYLIEEGVITKESFE